LGRNDGAARRCRRKDPDAGLASVHHSRRRDGLAREILGGAGGTGGQGSLKEVSGRFADPIVVERLEDLVNGGQPGTDLGAGGVGQAGGRTARWGVFEEEIDGTTIIVAEIHTNSPGR